jgi:hypothetical protein
MAFFIVTAVRTSNITWFASSWDIEWVLEWDLLNFMRLMRNYLKEK